MKWNLGKFFLINSSKTSLYVCMLTCEQIKGGYLQKKEKNRVGSLKIHNSFGLCIKKALERSMNWRENIFIDPAVLTGKPIIKSTLLAV